VSSDPRFTEFEQQVGEAFAHLLANYGFIHTGSGVYAIEWSVEYANSTTFVTVFLEVGSSVWVLIGSSLTRQAYDLGFYVAERAGEEVRVPSCVRGDPAVFRACLTELAGFVETYAADALRGDFSIFPRLWVRAKRRAKEKEDELFGRKREGSS